jgi:hypothetical protein
MKNVLLSLLIGVPIAALAGAMVGVVLQRAIPEAKQSSPSEPFQHSHESFMAELDAMGDDLDETDEPTRTMHATKGLPSPALYPLVPIAKLCVKDFWKRPRALIEGKVTYAKPEQDGDFHFLVEDDAGNKIVCEIVPQNVLPHPKVGDELYVYGVVRYDLLHKWVELHEVDGIKEK